MADIVNDFIERLRAVAPDVPPHIRQQLEVDIRQQWGGCDSYIAKRPTLAKQVGLGAALRMQKPLSQTFLDLGVKRWTGYRILRQK